MVICRRSNVAQSLANDVHRPLVSREERAVAGHGTDFESGEDPLDREITLPRRTCLPVDQ